MVVLYGTSTIAVCTIFLHGITTHPFSCVGRISLYGEYMQCVLVLAQQSKKQAKYLSR